MYPNTIPPNTKKVLNKIKKTNFLKSFYLTGGSALSLHLGHRESEDLDFFSKDNFDPVRLQQEIKGLGKLKDVVIQSGTLNLFLDQAQLQFLYYPYRLIKPYVRWQEISLSSVIDIACTKLRTIGMRGSKKDFIDIYFLLKTYSLNELFDSLEEKYQGVDYNIPHILKALVYFNDAEAQPMPRMHKKVPWGEVKKEVTKSAKAYKF